MSDRSGCSLVELAVLGALEIATAGRPRAYARSAKVLAGIDERIGLGPRYAYELLLDLARPWLTPVPIVAVAGNLGDRDLPVPADPEHTQCRPSHTGHLVLNAEAGRLPPVPVGLINGTTYRGGIQPPLDPFAVLAALRRILDDPGVPDGELLSIAGQPWSGTGCTVTGDLAALAEGRRVTLRETGQITITGVPVPQPPAPPPAGDAPRYAFGGTDGQMFPAHLVIDSLPARTVASQVAQDIASRSALASPGPHDTGHAGHGAGPTGADAEGAAFFSELPGVTRFLARQRLAFREVRQARRTAGWLAGVLMATLPGHRCGISPDGLRRVTRGQVAHRVSRRDGDRRRDGLRLR